MSKSENYPFTIFKEEGVSIARDLEFLESLSRVIPKEVYHHRYGIMQKNKNGWIDVSQAIQQNNLIKMEFEEFRYRCKTCKKLFSYEAGWRKHTEWMLACGRKCNCDVFSFAKYSHSLSGTSAAKV